MKRAIFLAKAVLLAMLILASMAMAQGTTMPTQGVTAPWVGGGGCPPGTPCPSGSPTPVPPGTGGSDILLPAAALLLGSGILTYAILRRR